MEFESLMESLAGDEVAPPVMPPAVSPPEQPLDQVVAEILKIDANKASSLVAESKRLYIDRMRGRFTTLKVNDRLKRTNPFLLQIRGAKTVAQWAQIQVTSALFASEEEAVGHVLEMIAMTCYPGASTPVYPDDFDLEAPGPNGEVWAYQVKMSWDCMPMSSRKNLSNTIRKLKNIYDSQGREVIGYFAPCYGKANTTKPNGQEYVSLSSREFWSRVGGGDPDFDVRVGEVCALLCGEFREQILNTLVPELISQLAHAATADIGNPDGTLNYTKLFRRINK